MKCPKCQANEQQYKAGLNKSGSQRYRCGMCNRVYTPAPLSSGYPPRVRELAIRMYLEGNSLRAIARILKVNHQSVANWVAQYTTQLPAPKVPKQSQVAELDELYTFVGNKKTRSTL